MSIPVRRQFSRDPFWFDDYSFDHPSRRGTFDQDFGMELDPSFDQDEFMFPPPPSWFRQAMLSHFNRPSFFNRFGRLRRRGSIGGIGGPSEFYCGKGRMQVTLDVTHFAPEELNVKLVDNFLVIEAKNEEEKKEGHGFIYRHFVRRYEIPASSPDFEIKPEDVNCNLNGEGVLTVEIQLEPPAEEVKGNEKVIPINMTSTLSTSSTSSSSKQYRHGHSSVHVKSTGESATTDFVENNGNSED